jgi:MoaA/NifB/PqqE/SkfB family radical SAM enzyme
MNQVFRYGTALTNAFIKPRHVRARPIHIQLEPTSYCNLKCIMCPHHVIVKKPNHMSLQNFKRVIDIIHPLKLTLSGIGEPLMNPDFLEMVHYVVSKGITVNTTTNGTIFQKDIMNEAILTSGLSLISVSVDAATAQTYYLIRQQDWHEKVIEGIKRVSEMKRRLGLKLPILRMCFVISPQNLHEVSAFLQLAQQLQIDLVYFQMMTVDMSLTHEKGSLIQGINLQKYKEVLLEARTQAKQLNINTNLSTILDKLRVFWRVYYEGCTDDALCPLPWFSLYVDVEGYIRPCCKFGADASSRMSESLFYTPIKSAWNNSKYYDFRIKMSKNQRFFKICQECVPETLEDIVKRSIYGYSKGFL